MSEQERPTSELRFKVDDRVKVVSGAGLARGTEGIVEHVHPGLRAYRVRLPFPMLPVQCADSELEAVSDE